MTFRTRLLVFGYPLVEIVLAYLVGVLIGWGWLLLLVILGIPVGLAVMRNAAHAALRDVASASPGAPTPDGSRHALAFVGGLLIAIPGFLTDLIGLLLVFPPTQRLFRNRSRAWFESRVSLVRMPGVRYPGVFGGADVIPGTVVRSADDSSRPGGGSGPDSGTAGPTGAPPILPS